MAVERGNGLKPTQCLAMALGTLAYNMICEKSLNDRQTNAAVNSIFPARINSIAESIMVIVLN